MDRFYFDHNATTPVSPEVLEALIPVLRDVYGNASSIHHHGQAAKRHMEAARRSTAALLGCRSKEIVFTSGGTEADNLAILGTVRAVSARRRHMVTTSIEHPAVLNTCGQLEREGVEITYLRVGAGGVVDPDDIRSAIRPETVLISVMHANNELGTIQPVEEISRITRDAGITCHSDGVQAVGKIPVDLGEMGVDLYSMSGHKIYAPKGVGALFAKGGTHLVPVMHGGRHERDRRPGTENVPGIAAFGFAIEGIQDGVPAGGVSELRDRLERGILDRVPRTFVNGQGSARVPNTTSIRFDGIGGEAMVIALDLKGFSVSSGAACSSGAVEPSHVLTAIGLTAEQARSSLRFSLGRTNTVEQVDLLIGAVTEAAARLRKLSPTYVPGD